MGYDYDDAYDELYVDNVLGKTRLSVCLSVCLRMCVIAVCRFICHFFLLCCIDVDDISFLLSSIYLLKLLVPFLAVIKVKFYQNEQALYSQQPLLSCHISPIDWRKDVTRKM